MFGNEKATLGRTTMRVDRFQTGALTCLAINGSYSLRGHWIHPFFKRSDGRRGLDCFGVAFLKRYPKLVAVARCAGQGLNASGSCFLLLGRWAFEVALPGFLYNARSRLSEMGLLHSPPPH